MAGVRRIRVGTLELDPIARLAWVDGSTVKLSNKEFGLLRALAEYYATAPERLVDEMRRWTARVEAEGRGYGRDATS